MIEFPVGLYEDAASWPGYHSQTSELVLKDMFDYVCRHKECGRGLIEVGCYKGSSSIVLAYLCQELGMPFHMIDINADYLRGARELLSFLGLKIEPDIFHGPLIKFAEEVELPASPVMIFIDANHRYDGVVEDINAIFKLNQRPYCAAFHDFSLRYGVELNPELNDVRVDEAIYDTLGRNVPFIRVGNQFPDGTAVPTKKKGAGYWEKDGSEGVLIELIGLSLVSS